MRPSLMLANDPVLVVPYEDEWPWLFRGQATQMRAALGQAALRIDTTSALPPCPGWRPSR
jgi:GrpB-like predicted nucleotidyltransferase (UPF0157 family)